MVNVLTWQSLTCTKMRESSKIYRQRILHVFIWQNKFYKCYHSPIVIFGKKKTCDIIRIIIFFEKKILTVGEKQTQNQHLQPPPPPAVVVDNAEPRLEVVEPVESDDSQSPGQSFEILETPTTDQGATATQLNLFELDGFFIMVWFGLVLLGYIRKKCYIQII